MKRLIVGMLLPALLAGPGCRQGDEANHGHEAGKELPSRAITQFTTKSEMFAEHPFLVVGEEAPFAAHVTDLRDYSPVTEGKLEAVLIAQDGQEQVFPVEGVLRPGIFRPVVKPAAPGAYRLQFRLRSPRLNDTIDVGPVTVYADPSSARNDAPAEEDNPDEISFLKEQQWKIPFMTKTVSSGYLEEGVSALGSVKPVSGRDAILSAPVTGRVLGRHRVYRLGDHVRDGQELALIAPSGDGSRSKAELAQSVTVADVTLRQAKLDLARAERLHEAQAVPRKRVEEARTAVQIAQAGVLAAKRQLTAKQSSLNALYGHSDEGFRVRAPVSGTVVEARLVPGAFVQEGATLYRIIDLRTVWVEATVHERDLSKISGGHRAEVKFPSGRTVTGDVVTIGSVLDPVSRTAPVIVAVPNHGGQIRIGMSADVRVLVGSSPIGPVIPRSALVDDNGRPIAYVLTGGESFERRELKLGIQQGDRVQVLSGLKAGDRLVTQGGYEIRLSTLSDAVPAHGHAH